MSNLTRYKIYNRGFRLGIELVDDNDGEFVKFDDIKEFLKPAANIDYTAVLEVEIKHWIKEQGIGVYYNDVRELSTRLNAAIQKQHCT